MAAARFLAAVLLTLFSFLSVPAVAQQVGAGCTPIGRGVGVTGYFSDCTTVTGTANAIILTPTFGNPPTTPQLVIFTTYRFQATATNTTAVTIRIGAAGPGPYNVYNNAGTALSAGGITNGRWYTVGFDPALNSSAGGWRLVAGDLGESSLLPSNNTWTGFNTFAPLTAASPAVAINPLVGSLGVGSLVTASPAGSFSGGVNGDIQYFNGVKITNWNVRDTTAGGFATFAGSGSQLWVNGANAYSPNGTVAFLADLITFTTAPASVGVVNQFAAILGRAIVKTNVPAGVTGFGMVGINANVAIDSGITGVASIAGFESDMTSIGQARSRFGYSTYLGPTDLFQGSVNDASFYWGVSPGTTPGWHNAFLLDATAGTVFDSGACILCVKGTLTIAKVVDVTDWTITGNVWASQGLTMTGLGDIGGRQGAFQFDQNGFSPFAVKNLSAGASAGAEYILQTGTTNSVAYWQLADQSGSPDVIFDTGSAVLRRFSRMNGTTMITETKGGGSQFGTPTGADCGVGCINAQAIRINNVAVSTTTGTVTSIATTGPITGGPISTTGTIACATCVTSAAALTANQLVLGGGSQASATLGSLGTTTTLLHGNAAGAPTFSAVVSADLNITSTACTNQFVTAISAGGVGTCTTDTLASAQHANQGTTTTVLHGNAAGNPSWAAVANADLVNSATTVNGQICTLGSTCTVTATASSALTIGTHLTGTSYNGSAPITIATDAVSTNTASTIVARDGSGNFAAGTITASLTGNASTVTGLTIANSLIQAGNFATTITSTATSNATLPAGTHTLATLDLQQNWTQGQLYLMSSALNTPLQFQDTNTGGQTWYLGPGTGTASPDEFNLFNNTTMATIIKFGKTGSITAAGHILATSTAPSISACGTGSPTVSGSDSFGTVVAGTVATTCVINFGVTWGAAPRCMASSGTAISSLTVSATTTQLTIGGTALGGDTINWVCGSTAWLLERDVSPASNDNTPLGLSQAA